MCHEVGLVTTNKSGPQVNVIASQQTAVLIANAYN